MDAVQSSFSVPKINAIEHVVHEGNTFRMDDDEGEYFPEETREISSRRGGDQAPFVTEMADILSSVASVMVDSMVSYFLDTMHSSSFDFNF